MTTSPAGVRFMVLLCCCFVCCWLCEKDQRVESRVTCLLLVVLFEKACRFFVVTFWTPLNPGVIESRIRGKPTKTNLLLINFLRGAKMVEGNQAEGEDNGDLDSADEALLSMLGLVDLDVKVIDDDEEGGARPTNSSFPTRANIDEILLSTAVASDYKRNGVVLFPSSLNVPAALMRRLTDELVWGGDKVRADKTYETIQLWKEGEIVERRTLTRLENFVDYHEEWKQLCRNYLADCISALVGQTMVLFKEKLNLKPPGGSGFAPHLDGPSLRMALQGENGPKTFVTVMVAIDNMTSQNGCLRVVKGPWAQDDTVEVIQPEANGNPDAGGRAGAIPLQVAETLEFEDLSCEGGSIAAFGEWTPHRSTANTSPFPRRAVFLTYNPGMLVARAGPSCCRVPWHHTSPHLACSHSSFRRRLSCQILSKNGFSPPGMEDQSWTGETKSIAARSRAGFGSLGNSTNLTCWQHYREENIQHFRIRARWSRQLKVGNPGRLGSDGPPSLA